MNTNHLNKRGFTLVELAVAVTIVGVLATVLLTRVLFYQEQAEKAAMEQMVGTIRSALHLQTAALFAQGRQGEIPRLLKQNPIDWLVEKPANYKGEYYAPKPGDIDPGNWYFDLQSGWLVYLVRDGEHFHADDGRIKQVRLQAKLVTTLQKNGTAADNAIEGATLEAVVPYKWF